jgi:hypothetical protein
VTDKMKKGCGLALAGGALLVVGLASVMPPCWSAWWSWGMVVPRCPAGEPRVVATVDTYGLERGREGTVNLYVEGSWIEPVWQDERRASFGEFDATMTLLVGDEEHPLSCEEDWGSRGHLGCNVTLPEDIPDGDHTLRVAFDTPLEDPVVEVRLPLYAPAHVHVLTDRPLYEPGNEVLFRSLSLRRGSLEPLDSRPGTWSVTSPSGHVLLEERNDGELWGISQSSFPLAGNAESGTWTVSWTTGADVGSATFEVRPFTLPRSTVEARSSRSWYGIGDAPVVNGVVNYTSGAPVQNATVELTLSSGGEWPPPNSWLGPHTVMTDASGSFQLELPEVPDDLHAPATVSVSIAATDTDGDRVTGGTRLLLSPTPIKVEAVTELGDGLVPDFNNRAYLRVSRPDGLPLVNTEVFLKNAWDVRDAGKTYTTDEDGVLAAQLDPGQPVNVVVPLAPTRPPPRTETRLVEVRDVQELLQRRAPSLAERRDLEVITDALEDCGRFGNYDLVVGLDVRGGRISAVNSEGEDGIYSCIDDALRGRILGTGDSIWRLRLGIEQAREISWVTVNHAQAQGSMPDEIRTQIDVARRDASACVAGRRADATPRFQLVWSTEQDSTTVTTRWAQNQSGAGAWPEEGCIKRAFSGLRLSEPAEVDSLGVARLAVDAWTPARPTGPRTTTTHGFEYIVEVEDIGETTWRSTPGAVPYLRLRPDQVLLEPGSELAVEFLRGPSWVGDLPLDLTLEGHNGTVQTCARTVKQHTTHIEWYEDCPEPKDDNFVRFSLPDDQTGFMQVQYDGARAVVYVQPTSELELELSTALSSYAPGSEATLVVQTSQPAVVSLVGVDSTLGQLAPLPGPDALSSQLVAASSSMPAYGDWDAVALTSGRIRGTNATLAAIQRVDMLTLASTELPWNSATAVSSFEPQEETMTVFWEVLGDVHDAVRAWEATDDGLLTNDRMAVLYGEVLDARADAGTPMTDPWGRRLELYLLPDELLNLVEPRVLVRDATKVPEDVVNWNHWVHMEMER